MTKKVAILLHENFEESEAVGVIDVLRRAKIIVDVYGLEQQKFVKGAHDINIAVDSHLSDLDVEAYDGFILPGGPGCEQLFSNADVLSIIQKFNQDKKMLAAICGAPQVLGKAGVLKGIKIVKHPLTNQYLTDAIIQSTNTCIDQNIVTGVSIGTTIFFALAIVKYLFGQAYADNISEQLVIF